MQRGAIDLGPATIGFIYREHSVPVRPADLEPAAQPRTICPLGTPAQSLCSRLRHGDVWLSQINRLERWQRKAALRLVRKSDQSARGRISSYRALKLW